MKWKVLPKKRDDLLEQLLINRGITKKEREDFFNPKISNFEKDLKIPGIERANKRILKAKELGELIVIFGDYDVDGICACAILYKGLTSLGIKVLPYIPHREKEGYGLSRLGLEFAKSSGASLVITVDNGIVAYDPAKYAKEIGLDLIITDHHIKGNKLPDAFEIAHSTKMCGAAIAWCLIRNEIKKDLAKELLQFVSIATICDLIPLVGLGRAFVYEGLKVLNTTTNLGLLSLIDETQIKPGEIGSFEIGYILGPRLNAIGRLEHAIDALRLLCTKDPGKAKNLARLLSQTNILRKKMTDEAIKEAKSLVDTKKAIQVLHSKKWSVGIIGLIAGKITDQYSRPTIAISIGENLAKGSARSVDGVNIVEFIRKFEDILMDVGGHPGAAGFSLHPAKVEIFKKRVEEFVLELPDNGEKILQIDAEVTSDQLDKKLVEDLQKFEPFGFGNPRPVFVSYGMAVSDIRTVGQGKHLKFKADNIDTIAFGMGELEPTLKNGQQINLVYTPEINVFNGAQNLQLKVKDIKVD